MDLPYGESRNVAALEPSGRAWHSSGDDANRPAPGALGKRYRGPPSLFRQSFMVDLGCEAVSHRAGPHVLRDGRHGEFCCDVMQRVTHDVHLSGVNLGVFSLNGGNNPARCQRDM